MLCTYDIALCSFGTSAAFKDVDVHLIKLFLKKLGWGFLFVSLSCSLDILYLSFVYFKGKSIEN